MENSIPAAKSKSKIKPLEDKIQILTDENETLLEELYESGLRTRPTIMTRIEDKEADTRKTIALYIKECERITGRKLSCPDYPIHKIPLPHSASDWKEALGDLLIQSYEQRWTRGRTHSALKNLIRKY